MASSMAYVLTTFFIMGFGYFVAVTALNRPLPGRAWAWARFWMAILGVVMARHSDRVRSGLGAFHLLPAADGKRLVLHRAGARGCGIVDLVRADARRDAAWKRENPGRPVPLAMFATVANAVMWLWTTVGVAVELVFQVIPAALGLVQTIDVGLSRTLFSWTLHAIVYFWLIPAYIAFYTMAPRAAGGRLYSDTMGRLTFILFLIYSLPVGMHHLLMDPEHGNGTKFIQVLLTAFVSVPTLLTIFTITASLEIAGRLRGGRGLFGWIAALALGTPDGARHRPCLRHARLRRFRRHRQHGLRHERHGPQHLMGDGALPSDLRRLGGDHVFRHRLRNLAAPDRTRASIARLRCACSFGCGSSA